MKLSKKVLAVAISNREDMNEAGQKSATRSGGNFKPLTGHQNLTILETRNFGKSEQHMSIVFNIGETKIRANMNFYNINSGDAAEYTVKQLIKTLSFLGFPLDPEGDFAGLSEDNHELIGKPASGIVLISGEHNGYNNYSVVSDLSKWDGGSSTEWLQGVWDYNVLGLSRDGEKVSDSPFFSFTNTVKGAKEEFFATAYDADDSPPIAETKVVAKAAPKAEVEEDDDEYDNDVPF